MNIVHLNWSLGTGGTETMLVDIANEQARLGHCVSIICLNNLIYDPIRQKVSESVNFFCMNRKPKSIGLIAIIKMNILLFKIEPDIIHVHPNQLAKLIKLGSYKMVRTLHSTQGDGKDSPLFNKLCFISEGVRQHSLSQGYDGNVVYNGIVTDSIKVKKNNNKRWDSAFLKIVQIGRLEEFKGQHLLLKAIAKLKTEGVNRFHIDFIGEGSYEEKLKVLVSELGLKNEVVFLGLKSRDYIYEHLCEYDLFVQPSVSEGFGLTIAEAMAAKVPVITSDLAGPMEVINQGKYGLHFASGNYLELVQILKDYTPDNLPYNIDDARKYVLENFSITRTATDYLKIYQEVINNY